MPEPKDYARRLVRGSANVFVALIVAGSVALLFRMFLIRTCGLDDYGLFYWAFSFVSIFAIFRDFGFYTALTKFIPEFTHKKQLGKIKSLMATITLILMLSGGVITLILFIFSDQIALATIGTLKASILIKIFSLWFFLMAFFFVFRATFRGFQDMTIYGAMEVLYILSIFLLATLLIYIFNLGIIGAAVGYVITAAALAILYFALFKKKHPDVLREKVQVEKPLIKKMITYTLPLFLSSIGGLFLTYIGTILIGVFYTQTQVGLYETAVPLASLVSYFPAALGVTLMPLVSELTVRGEKELLTQAVHFLVKFSFMLVVPLVFIFVAFPDVTLSSIFTSESLPATAALQILSLAIIANTLIGILERVAAGIGKTIIITKITGAMACVNILGNLILIPRYGIEGAAMATFISALVGLFILVYLVRQFVKFTLPISSIIKTLVAAAVMLFLIFALKQIIALYPWWLEFIVVVIPSLLCYLVLITAMKAVRKQDLSILKEILPIPKKLVKIANRLIRD